MFKRIIYDRHFTRTRTHRYMYRSEIEENVNENKTKKTTLKNDDDDDTHTHTCKESEKKCRILMAQQRECDRKREASTWNLFETRSETRSNESTKTRKTSSSFYKLLNANIRSVTSLVQVGCKKSEETEKSADKTELNWNELGSQTAMHAMDCCGATRQKEKYVAKKTIFNVQ